MKTRPLKIAMSRLFMESPEAVLSGEFIAGALSISRQSVWRIVQELVDEGFAIETLPQKGYRLLSAPLYDLAPSHLGARLPRDCPWGGDIAVHDSLPSTQEEAKRLGRSGETDGLVVIAEEQTRGRGRRDRSWVSPKGTGLYFSVYFRPKLYPGALQLVNLAAGLAVMEGVERSLGVALSLKWPNDLLLRGKKICGILSEASSDSEVIRDCCTGIGLNIAPPEAKIAREGLENAAYLAASVDEVDRGALVAAILPLFAGYVAELVTNAAAVLSRYRLACDTLGRLVTVHTDGEIFRGTAVEIGSSGELVLALGDERRAFYAADVVHATPAATTEQDGERE